MTKQEKAIAIIPLIYVVAICVFMILHRIWFSPDQFFVFALIGSLILGRTHLFILDWGPFISLFLGYEFLRGLVPLISKNVHIFSMIKADQLIFGFVPTIKLQSWLYNPTNLHWYDYVAVTLYICHFVTPMIVGFFFWLKSRTFFKEYSIAFLVLSYSAFITYILFPAMPPWMAASQGYLPPIKEVTGVVMSHFFATTFQLPSIYSIMRSNPVAAMPSLHAAFPMLIFLFLLKYSRKAGLLFLPYVFGVWFSVIYLGEHYFIDVLAGALYALAAFVVVERRSIFFKKLAFLPSNLSKMAIFPRNFYSSKISATEPLEQLSSSQVK